MRRIALLGALLTLLVGADGVYMLVSKYHSSDVNGFNLSDGGTILLSAAILLVVTLVAFALSFRQPRPVPAPTTPEAER